MRLALLALLALLTTPTLGDFVQFNATSGAFCSTQSVIESQTLFNQAIEAQIASNKTARAQGFQHENSVTLYSVTFWVRDTATTNMDIEFRFDDDRDMSVEYIAQLFLSGINSDVGTIEFVFDSENRPVIAANTTYYIAANEIGTVQGMLIGSRTGNPYRSSPHSTWTDRVSFAVPTWDFNTTGEWADNDLQFEVRACD